MMSRFMKVCSITIILALLVNLLPVQVLAADHKPMSAITEPVLMESLQAEQAASATIVAEIEENRTAFSKAIKHQSCWKTCFGNVNPSTNLSKFVLMICSTVTAEPVFISCGC